MIALSGGSQNCLAPMNEVTRVLSAVEQGDPHAAEQLLPLVYEELRKLEGIIHRDLKPSNVLVTLHDGTPVVKVIDFGIAKALGQQLTETTLFTGFAQMVGTPLYMSPEQAGLSGLDVDTRSDLYSLGVLLYELLTGTTPFDRERLRRSAYEEILRIIREEEPPKPSTRITAHGQAAQTISTQRQSDPRRLSRLLQGELDWIVMKALEKDRSRRYATAQELADDMRRYLDDEPVHARPPTLVQRAAKWSWRHRSAARAAAAVLLLAMVGLAVGTWLIWQEKEQTKTALAHAQTNAERADTNLRRALEALEKISLHVDEKEWPAQPQFDRPDRALLEQMLQFYEQFAQENEADPAVKRETAKAYIRVGKIHEDLRRLPDAKQAYARAVTLLRQVAEEQPNRIDVQDELADCSHSLADILFDRGSQKEGEQAYREAITIYGKLAQRDDTPEVFRYRGQLSECLYYLGDRLRHTGRAVEAQPLYRQATALLEKLAEETPSDPEALHHLAWAFQ
jgi:tetratricopeptide (TPR) repeat protein